MRRSLLTLVVLLVSFSLLVGQEKTKAVGGGTGRTAALGGGPSNPYITDYTDIFVNPAYALTYSDLLYSDVGYNFAAYRASGQFIGWTLGMGDLALGLSIGHHEGPMFAENAYGTGLFAASDYMKPSLDAYLGFATTEPLPPIQLYGAVNVGGAKFGVGLYRSSWSMSDDGRGTVGALQKLTASNNQTGIKVGTVMDIFDAAAFFRLNSSSADFTDNNTGANPSATSYKATGTEFGVNARAFMKMSPKIWIVPQARFSTYSYKPDLSSNATPAPATPNPNPNEYGRTEFEAGVGINTKLEAGMVSVGLSLQSISLKHNVTTVAAGQLQTTKNTQSWLDLPKLNLGAELDVTSWLVARLGYFKRFSSMTTTVEPPTGAKTESSVSVEAGYAPNLGFTNIDQQYSMGLGIMIDRISLDGYVGERFVAAGPFILSGNAQNLFGVLSLSYKF